MQTTKELEQIVAAERPVCGGDHRMRLRAPERGESYQCCDSRDCSYKNTTTNRYGEPGRSYCGYAGVRA